MKSNIEKNDKSRLEAAAQELADIIVRAVENDINKKCESAQIDERTVAKQAEEIKNLRALVNELKFVQDKKWPEGEHAENYFYILHIKEARVPYVVAQFAKDAYLKYPLVFYNKKDSEDKSAWYTVDKDGEPEAVTGEIIAWKRIQ